MSDVKLFEWEFHLLGLAMTFSKLSLWQKISWEKQRDIGLKFLKSNYLEPAVKPQGHSYVNYISKDTPSLPHHLHYTFNFPLSNCEDLSIKKKFTLGIWHDNAYLD